MKRRILGLVIGLCLVLAPHLAFGALFQILHTNDIHAHLDHATHKPDLGGYGQLKVQLEEFRQWGASNGIKTIAMDAGDYLEGNIYYLADRGKSVYKVHGQAGFDVSVIGNHDYLMGAHDLNDIMRDVKTSFQLLGANFHVDKKYKEVNEGIKPYWETEIDGIKIGVVGITLDDVLYKWRIEEGDISDEVKAAKKYAKELRERGNDIVIALTHVGFSKDKKIAKAVPEIDLIVGGHSHDALFKVHYEKSKGGKKIPIVQAGKHLEWLGQLLIDYDKKSKKLRVAHYQLHPVKATTKDQGIQLEIDLANDSLYDLFGAGWLNEVVGYSNLRAPHFGGDTKIWQYLIIDSMKDSTDSDFSLNAQALSGTNYPTTGPITRRNLYDSNPRQFEFDHKYGYNVYTARVKGMWISLVFRVVMQFNIPLYVSGLKFDYEKAKLGSGYKVKNLRIHGKRINPFKLYKVAMPEAIVRGGFAITKWVGLLLKYCDDYKISMWQALEDRVRKLGVIDEDYLSKYFYSKKESENFRAPALAPEVDRVFVP